jgi:hypothetical protein
MARLPKGFGHVLWRGGTGQLGKMGGWGFRCDYCKLGDKNSAMKSKRTAEDELIGHVLRMHPAEPPVRDIIDANASHRILY